MTTIMQMREFKQHLDSIHDGIERGTVIGLMEATNYGVAQAKLNAQRNFTGRHGYRKTGALLNSIYAEFETKGDSPEGAIAVHAYKGRDGADGETKPYGRIQEYGGTVEPVDAKWLWQPLWDSRPPIFRWLTPRQFIARMKGTPSQFGIVPTHDGRGRIAAWFDRGDVVGLFLLRKKSIIPPRPYVTPAAEAAFKLLPGMVLKRIKEQQGKA
jgi:hypothetical protein